jgi:flavin-dependent dehydrogenase
MYDALVAGGGPGGAAAALVLARRGLRVLLVDATPSVATRLKVGESLPPGARPLLRDLGLLAAVEAEGQLRSSGTTSVWGSPEPTGIDFVLGPDGPGWHLDRDRFDRSLRDAAVAAGAELRTEVAARAPSRAGNGWRVRLGEGEQVEARALVDATGRRASLARVLGARRRRSDRLVGLVGVAAAGEEDRDARTLVEAAPEGWWYTALVPGRRRVVAFMSDADLLPSGIRSAGGYRAALARTEYVGPLAEAASEPQTEAADGSRLEPVCGDGWIAVGDAALAFDPLSSQGILTALYDGMTGAEALAAFLAGDRDALNQYRTHLDAIAAAYERNLLQAYRSEIRWPGNPFWARRQRVENPGTSSTKEGRRWRVGI